MSKVGIETVGFDYRGFGKSEGPRGVCESNDTLISDSEAFIKHIEEEYKGENIFAGGQSWGGQIIYTITLDNPKRFKGVVLYAPAIKDNNKSS